MRRTCHLRTNFAHFHTYAPVSFGFMCSFFIKVGVLAHPFGHPSTTPHCG